MGRTKLPVKKSKRMKVKKKKEKKIKKIFYKCKKTLKMRETKEVCFKKGEKYLFIRNIKTNTPELKGMILNSETQAEHVIKNNNWGKHFKIIKKKKK